MICDDCGKSIPRIQADGWETNTMPRGLDDLQFCPICAKGGLKVEMKPGIYDNMPFQTYDDLVAVSNSYLGRLDKCPANARIEPEDTLSLIFGRAAHCYILQGPEAFASEFAISPQFDKRTKDGKAGFAAFQANNIDKAIIAEEDFNAIQRMNEAVRSHPTAKDLCSEGVAEKTVIWQDEETGILCKARPDWIPNRIKGLMIDLKTTRDASEHAFCRSVVSYGYARQAAMYIESFAMAAEIDIDIFCDIVVETEEPYRVEVYQLDPDFISWGYGEFKRLLRIENDCRTKGNYPHYQNPGAQVLVKPGYLDNY